MTNYTGTGLIAGTLRTIAGVLLLGLGATSLGFIVQPTAANAATTYPRKVEGTGGVGLKIRSGPGTTYQHVGTARDGSTVIVVCWVKGEALTNPRTGNSYNVWDRLEGGDRYVWDAFVSGNTTRDIPKCGSTPPATGEPAVAAGKEAASRAQSMVGQKHQPNGEPWSGMCLRAVGVMWGRTTGGYVTARAAYDDWKRRGLIRAGQPPIGAVVFYDTPFAGDHVGVYIGNGQVVSTQGSSASNPQPIAAHALTKYPLLGWADPPSDWAGLKWRYAAKWGERPRIDAVR